MRICASIRNRNAPCRDRRTISQFLDLTESTEDVATCVLAARLDRRLPILPPAMPAILRSPAGHRNSVPILAALALLVTATHAGAQHATATVAGSVSIPASD